MAVKMLTGNNELVDINALASLEKEERAKRRFGWLVLFVGFGGFLLWAIFAPLDAGVPLHGQIKVLGDKKIIQHPFGGAVKQIIVTDGQKVELGEPLIVFDTTLSVSEREVLRTQWVGFAAVKARLTAELSNSSEINFPQWFADNSEDERVRQVMKLQTELFRSRQLGQEAQLSAVSGNIKALTRSVNDLEQGLISRKNQLSIYERRLEGIQKMADAGYLPANRLLEAQGDLSQLLSGISDDTARLAQLEGQLAESKQNLERLKAGFLEDAQTRLTEIDNRLAELTDRLVTADYRASADTVKAPVAGYVTELKVNTVGAVVRSGEDLLAIVPDVNSFEVEAALPIDKVDTVSPGMEVELMFNSLSATHTPKMPAILKTISADAIADPKSGMSFYQVRISLPTDYMKYLGGFKIQPGMPVSAFVKEGERSLMVYLFKPLTDRLHQGLTEE